MSDFLDPITAQLEPELMASRRAFPVAQALLAGGAQRTAAAAAQVEWHDSVEHPETGAVALAPISGEFSDLVGEIVKVTRTDGGRSVYVYVVGSTDLPDGVALSLARRPFLALGLLANEYLVCTVEVNG